MSEKTNVARNSVIASGVLSLLKLSVGGLTGSLALISEGIHSSLDFFATLITWFSVQTAERPADETHHYGHGKIENLSAFAESILLLGTACFIVFEAVAKLINLHEHKIENNFWAIGAIVVSILVDFSRGMALRRAAKKFKSQALEADSLHFLVELLSSGMVLAGLLLVTFGGEKFLWADPAAAIAVAVVMLGLAGTLAKRSADILMDRAPEGLEREMQQMIRGIPGVHNVPRVRARQSGANTFVDATITVDPNMGLAGGHQIASTVELAVTERFANTDIIVHVEPAEADGGDNTAAIRELASAMRLNIHAIRIREIEGRLYINFHLELPPDMPLSRAHELVTTLEQRIRLRLPMVAEIDSHLEPVGAGH